MLGRLKVDEFGAKGFCGQSQTMLSLALLQPPSLPLALPLAVATAARTATPTVDPPFHYHCLYHYPYLPTARRSRDSSNSL